MNTQANGDYQANPDAFGRLVSTHLSEGAEDLPHDIAERLKVARSRAVAKRKVVSVRVASEVSVSGGMALLHWGSNEDGLWNRVASLLPLLVLILGLFFIAVSQEDMRAREVAEVDAELLTDELPPAAYTDPGFAQFLRANQANLR